MADPEELYRQVMNVGYHLHNEIGPGLLETVYETLLADRLTADGFTVEVQKPIDINLQGRQFVGAFRVDLIVNSALLVEIKSVENLASVHIKQPLTYIRLLNMPLGMLINFGGATFKGNIKRIMNDRTAQP